MLPELSVSAQLCGVGHGKHEKIHVFRVIDVAGICSRRLDAILRTVVRRTRCDTITNGSEMSPAAAAFDGCAVHAGVVLVAAGLRGLHKHAAGEATRRARPRNMHAVRIHESAIVPGVLLGGPARRSALCGANCSLVCDTST